MSSSLSAAIAALSSRDSSARMMAAKEVYNSGRSLAERAASSWWGNTELAALLYAPNPIVTVGLAVTRPTFADVRAANGAPPMSLVPPDQDAEEFELHFPDGISLDVLTTREPGGPGAIARYLSKFGEGVQQVEFCCSDVDRATAILGEAFGVSPIYPQTRPGADGTRVNFFLVSMPDGAKVLVELYAIAEDHS